MKETCLEEWLCFESSGQSGELLAWPVGPSVNINTASPWNHSLALNFQVLKPDLIKGKAGDKKVKR